MSIAVMKWDYQDVPEMIELFVSDLGDEVSNECEMWCESGSFGLMFEVSMKSALEYLDYYTDKHGLPAESAERIRVWLLGLPWETRDLDEPTIMFVVVS